jgi:hypothetical protein
MLLNKLDLPCSKAAALKASFDDAEAVRKSVP